jgi:hypothetical protein
MIDHGGVAAAREIAPPHRIPNIATSIAAAAAAPSPVKRKV